MWCFLTQTCLDFTFLPLVGLRVPHTYAWWCGSHPNPILQIRVVWTSDHVDSPEKEVFVQASSVFSLSQSTLGLGLTSAFFALVFSWSTISFKCPSWTSWSRKGLAFLYFMPLFSRGRHIYTVDCIFWDFPSWGVAFVVRHLSNFSEEFVD